MRLSSCSSYPRQAALMAVDERCFAGDKAGKIEMIDPPVDQWAWKVSHFRGTRERPIDEWQHVSFAPSITATPAFVAATFCRTQESSASQRCETLITIDYPSTTAPSFTE